MKCSIPENIMFNSTLIIIINNFYVCLCNLIDKIIYDEIQSFVSIAHFTQEKTNYCHDRESNPI